MKRLFLFVGRSGSGKTTVADALCASNNLHCAVSMTTRPPRSPAEKGHYFVKPEAFKIHKVVAQKTYNGSVYGTTFEELDKSDIFIVDPDGADEVVHLYRRLHKKCTVLYFDIDRFTSKRRMEERGDDPSNIKRRLWEDDGLFAHIPYGAHYINAKRPLQDVIEEVKSQIASFDF